MKKCWIYLIKSKLSIDSYIEKAKAHGISIKVPLEILNQVKLDDWVTCAMTILSEDKPEAQIFLEFRISAINSESLTVSCYPGTIRIVPTPHPTLVGVKYQRSLKLFDRGRFWKVVRQFVQGRKNIKLRIKARFTPK